MRLFMFPRRPGSGHPLNVRPPFALNTPVRLLSERHSPAVVVGHRRAFAQSWEVLVRRPDGSESWLWATAVRAAHFELHLIDGGRSDDAALDRQAVPA